MAVSPSILIAPLDWGLGHATRCVPVIKYLQRQGCTIRIGASGPVALLLRANFPGIEILPLEGYNIRYSRERKFFAAKIIFQVPRILRAIRREKKWLEQQQALYNFDLVISDNRYGLWHKNVFSVIMTHQLQIDSGKGRLVNRLLRRLHYPLLRRFDQCWVVDNPGKDNIGGSLSHPAVIPANARYIGLLSQVQPQKAGITKAGHILVLLSGPEPMRSMLEKLLLEQAAGCASFTFTFVAGNPGGSPAAIPPNIVYHSYLDARALQACLAEAALVICRSGYSTLMDLAATGGKALLVPTPGQAEQEYLARYLEGQGLFFSRKQEFLNLEEDILTALQYPGFSGRDYYREDQLLGEALAATGKFSVK